MIAATDSLSLLKGDSTSFASFDANTGVQKWQFAVGNNALQTSTPVIYGRTSL